MLLELLALLVLLVSLVLLVVLLLLLLVLLLLSSLRLFLLSGLCPLLLFFSVQLFKAFEMLQKHYQKLVSYYC